jgi:dipeptidyl aminopeptidase/acylaminoacyl peptidase
MRVPALGLLTTLVLPFVTISSQSLPLRQSALGLAARDPSVRVPLDSTTEGRWLGTSPGTARWDIDGRWLYFSYDTAVVMTDSVLPETPWWRVSRDGRKIESVSQEDALAIPVSVTWTRDGRKAAWFHRGELRIRDNGAERILLRKAGGMFPYWSEDEREVRWLDDSDLWGADATTGTIRQITRTHVAREAPKDKPLNATLKREQLELFEFVQRNRAREDSGLVRSRRTRAPAPYVVVKPKATDNINQLALSPDNKWLTYVVTPRAEEVQTVWGDYVNDSGVVITRTGRAKVGTPPSRGRIAIVAADSMIDADSVKITWVIDDTTAFPGAVRALSVSWSPNGRHLVAEYASMDYKDRWIVLVDPATGAHKRVLHHEHDDAWLLESSGLTWLPDGNRFAIISEATGWQHLVMVDTAGVVTPLTEGRWEVRGAELSRDGTTWWLRTSEEHPSEVHLYTMPASGGPRTRIDRMGEGQAIAIRSPDDRALALRWSEPDALTDLYLMPTLQASPIRVTHSGTDAFWRINWPRSEFVAFADERGDTSWARVYLPNTAHPNRPAVLEIHGAGYAQGVHKSFKGSGAHGGSLYAKHLTDLGVVYVVLDYRGSAGYGRDVRTAVHRSMGDRDVASAVAAIPFLQQRYGVNPRKVGLFGCSYGGFYTLMALFRHPGTFAGGVAQCSVTDWSHYNHWYTARILGGSPSDDSTAYRVSSPIRYAEGLTDPLILQHGLIDGNVQYQDAVRLVQRLLELGKDFEFVTYPIDAHGWQSPWARRDSQRRMQKLWERVLLD